VYLLAGEVIQPPRSQKGTRTGTTSTESERDKDRGPRLFTTLDVRIKWYPIGPANIRLALPGKTLAYFCYTVSDKEEKLYKSDTSRSNPKRRFSYSPLLFFSNTCFPEIDFDFETAAKAWLDFCSRKVAFYSIYSSVFQKYQFW